MKNFYVLDCYQNLTITYANSYKKTLATVQWLNECNKKNFGDDKRFMVIDKEIKK